MRLLGHLGTRPRTTYLADVRNPEPDAQRMAVHERSRRASAGQSSPSVDRGGPRKLRRRDRRDFRSRSCNVRRDSDGGSPCMFASLLVFATIVAIGVLVHQGHRRLGREYDRSSGVMPSRAMSGGSRSAAAAR